jgi:neutral ceramidase
VPAWATLYRHWSRWARTTAREPLAPWQGRVTGFTWNGIPLVFLPGEIFASTALAIRASLAANPTSIIVSLADANPGYIPPRDECANGGYEVAEAHRYYGMPAAFAPGAAEVLVEAARGLGSIAGGY